MGHHVHAGKVAEDASLHLLGPRFKLPAAFQCLVRQCNRLRLFEKASRARLPIKSVDGQPLESEMLELPARRAQMKECLLGLDEPAIGLPKIEVDHGHCLFAPAPVKQARTDDEYGLEVAGGDHALELNDLLVRFVQP